MLANLIVRQIKQLSEVGLACGFGSAPHFVQPTKGFFGISPREEVIKVTIKPHPVQMDKKKRRFGKVNLNMGSALFLRDFLYSTYSVSDCLLISVVLLLR